MFCPKCGHQIPDTAKFCPACGAQINIDQPDNAKPPSETDNQKVPSETTAQKSPAATVAGKNSRNKFLIPILIVVVAAVILIIVIVATRPGRRDTADLNSYSDTSAVENEAEEREEEEREEEQAEELEASGSLDDNITISDITVTPCYIYNYYADHTYDFRAYAIGMTISNENDVCCDVYPSLQVSIPVENGYGDQKTNVLQLLNLSSYDSYTVYGSPDKTNWFGGDYCFGCPYSRHITTGGTDDENYLMPIGLAPHETKTIYYYVDEAACKDPDNGLEYYVEFGEDYEGSFQISSAEVIDFYTEEAPVTYIPVSEWGNSVWAETYKFDTMLGNYTFLCGGDVANTTGERLSSITMNLDVRVNGNILNAKSTETYASQTVEYVDVGEDVEFSMQGTSDYGLGSEGQVEAAPALLYYKVDTSDYSDWETDVTQE